MPAGKKYFIIVRGGVFVKMYSVTKEVAMKQVLAVFLLLVLTGCTTTQKGATAGALGGAALGGIIGHQSGHGGEGAAMGAAAGALTGYIIGDKIEAREKERQYQSQ